MCVTQQPVCVPGHIHVLAYLLADTEYILVDIGINGISVQHDESMCVCVRVQVAQYRSNKQEARRAKLTEEQAELDDMYKKQAEEDVCFLSA